MVRAMYHEPDVKQGRIIEGKRSFVAKCACGWQGPNRSSPHDAEDDCTEHRIAENEP